jgi:hypothetical protein
VYYQYTSTIFTLVHQASNSYLPARGGLRTKNQNNRQQARSNKEQIGSVCRFSDWPTAGFCWTHALKHPAEIARTRETFQKCIHIHQILVRLGGCNDNGKTCPVVLVFCFEARKGEMKVERIDFQRKTHSTTTTNRLDIVRYTLDLDGMGCNKKQGDMPHGPCHGPEA